MFITSSRNVQPLHPFTKRKIKILVWVRRKRFISHVEFGARFCVSMYTIEIAYVQCVLSVLADNSDFLFIQVSHYTKLIKRLREFIFCCYNNFLLTTMTYEINFHPFPYYKTENSSNLKNYWKMAFLATKI